MPRRWPSRSAPPKAKRKRQVWCDANQKDAYRHNRYASFFSGKYFDPFTGRFGSFPRHPLFKVRADLDHLVLAERIEEAADHHQNTEDDRDSAEAKINAVADALRLDHSGIVIMEEIQYHRRQEAGNTAAAAHSQRRERKKRTRER